MTVHFIGAGPGAPDLLTLRGRDLIAAAHGVYQPNKVIHGVAGPVEKFAKELPVEKTSAVYLCTGTACQKPTSNALKLREMMASKKLP